MSECECSDEYGPCEDHGETLVWREGASTRTADELMLVLCQDLVDLGAELSPWGADVLARAEAAAVRCRDPRTGTMWFDQGREPIMDTLTMLADQLEADSGLSVWMDDGYRIVRPTADCPLYV
jgi:hypothetical protein